MTNDWMKDESLKDIEPYKLEFLQALIFESSNLKKEQLMPFFMAVMKKGISCSFLRLLLSNTRACRNSSL